MSKVYYNTDNDDALCEMVNLGNRTKDAIIALGSTGSSIRKRARKITAGNNLQETIRRPWTLDEKTRLPELIEEGYSVPEIAVKMARSEASVYYHVKQELDPDAAMEFRARMQASKRDRKHKPVQRSREFTPRKCPTCGKTFVPEVGSTQRTYCSRTCRLMAEPTHNAPTAQFRCAKCGKLVETFGSDSRTKFCSPHCEKLYWKHPRKKTEVSE